MRSGQRRCKAESCRQTFTPRFNTLEPTCSPSCALEWLRSKQGQEAVAKVKRQETRVGRERLKTHPQLTKEAQREFNKWIRLRDKDMPCITCGRHDWEIPDTWVGGKWDAGHFKTIGGFPELRFQPSNCHKQCKSCNSAGPHKAEEVRVAYQENILTRISQAQLDWIEGPHNPNKHTHDELREIKRHYQQLIRESASRTAA